MYLRVHDAGVFSSWSDPPDESSSLPETEITINPLELEPLPETEIRDQMQLEPLYQTENIHQIELEPLYETKIIHQLELELLYETKIIIHQLDETKVIVKFYK